MNTNNFLIATCVFLASSAVLAQEKVANDPLSSSDSAMQSRVDRQAGNQTYSVGDPEHVQNKIVVNDNLKPLKTRAEVKEELRQAALQGQVPIDLEVDANRFLAQRDMWRTGETSSGQ